MSYYTKLVGIINITPDSIDGGTDSRSIEMLLSGINALIYEGADIIDIGAESSNPKSKEISGEEELRRPKPLFEHIFDVFPHQDFSIDTRNPAMANMFLERGGVMINDYTGFQNPNMLSVAQSQECLCVVNHFPGHSIQEVHVRPKINSISTVVADLLASKERMIASGIKEKNIILDPGIGFGKTRELNWRLLKLKEMLPEECVYIGYSQKGFLGKRRFQKEENKRVGEIVLSTKPEYIRLHNPALLVA